MGMAPGEKADLWTVDEKAWRFPCLVKTLSMQMASVPLLNLLCEFRRNPAGHTDLKPAAVPI